MNIALIGAGKMGLPLACVFADRGGRVIACDANPQVVEAINSGRSPIDEPGVQDILQRAVQAGRLSATTDTPEAVAQSEAVVVIVPVLLTLEKKADTRIIESVTRQIALRLRPGTMVSYETTLPIGGTRALLPILESGGLRGGRDFDLVFSPERVKSQLVIERLTKNPKIVGGLTPEAAARAAAFYGEYLGAPVINVGALETAEMVKLAGMVYRDVNIALANELARYCEAAGIDFPTVVQAANNDGEASLLHAGIGVGGHCTPVYPHFLFQESERFGVHAPLAELGRLLNDQQPAKVLDRLEREWQPVRGKRVLILGLGFRPQVKEDACSPAYTLAAELARRRARVELHDPLYTPDEIRNRGFSPGAFAVKGARWKTLSREESPMHELLILNTAHAAYADLDFKKLAALGLKAVLDGRNFWKAEQVEKAGLFYLAIGRP
ncbi:MAG: nucleotide sugar dehydrogenase [Candidatus Brocadiia bacterium]|jgi:nucleotide sugar dehydrogenase